MSPGLSQVCPTPQVPLPQELQGQQSSGRRNKGTPQVGKSQKDKQVGVGHSPVPAQPQEPPRSLALKSSHAPVKLSDNPSHELACPGHSRSPGSLAHKQVTNSELSAHPAGLAVAFWGHQSHSNTGEPWEIPSRVPLKINLHSHGSSGLIFPLFLPSRSRRLRGRHPYRSGAMSLPDVTGDAPWPTPDTRLGDKRHFSALRNLSPCSCWGAARALLLAGPTSSSIQPLLSSCCRGRMG